MCKINVRYKSNAGTEPYELKNSIQNNKGTHTSHAMPSPTETSNKISWNWSKKIRETWQQLMPGI
jgi:hypothetical protein